MNVTKDNIEKVNQHLQEVAKELSLSPEAFPKLEIGDSEFDLELDCRLYFRFGRFY